MSTGIATNLLILAVPLCTFLRVFPEFVTASYAKRYELFCRKLVRERHYNVAAFLMAEKKGGLTGRYLEPADDLTFEMFSKSLVAQVTAFGVSTKR